MTFNFEISRADCITLYSVHEGGKHCNLNQRVYTLSFTAIYRTHLYGSFHIRNKGLNQEAVQSCFNFHNQEKMDKVVGNGW